MGVGQLFGLWALCGGLSVGGGLVMGVVFTTQCVDGIAGELGGEKPPLVVFFSPIGSDFAPPDLVVKMTIFATPSQTGAGSMVVGGGYSGIKLDGVS